MPESDTPKPVTHFVHRRPERAAFQLFHNLTITGRDESLKYWWAFARYRQSQSRMTSDSLRQDSGKASLEAGQRWQAKMQLKLASMNENASATRVESRKKEIKHTRVPNSVAFCSI